MLLKREDAIKVVADGLAWLESSCKYRGLLHLFDNNVLSHHFFCRLLNGLYGLDLEVMDRIQSNYPAIDLGDGAKRIAYQVTTERSGDKMQRTLDKFVEHGLQGKFDKLKVLVIGQRQDRYTALTIPNEITFDPAEDILDLKNLLKDADALSTSSLEQMAQIFDEELHHTKRQPVLPGQGSVIASYGQTGGQTAHSIINYFNTSLSNHGCFCVTTHIGTRESINAAHCERHGRPVVPSWLRANPKRMGSDWLVDRLLSNSELQLYFDPNWYGGTWFVADLKLGDAVVINRDQLRDIMPSSPTTTTTPSPQSA